MTTAHRILDPFLSAADFRAVRERIRGGGPYGLYVTASIAQGLGAGLTRRHDAALAWVKRQLAAGSTESMEVQAARSNLFRKTWMERGRRLLDCADVVDHRGLAAASRTLLGAAVVEPYMLYANLLLPGQELPVHHDTPEFAGLDKTVCPEWFLVVCGRSGLFEDRRIRVSSAVVFVEGQGALVTYPSGASAPPRLVPPSPNTAIVLDADELVHGVERVGGPDAPAPPVQIGMTLAWEADAWVLRRGEAEQARYEAGQVRLSLQWKAWLWQGREHRARILDRPLSMAEATAGLLEELRRRGHALDPMPDDTDLALLMIEEFIELPTA
jgi:hypothetical protein